MALLEACFGGGGEGFIPAGISFFGVGEGDFSSTDAGPSGAVSLDGVSLDAGWTGGGFKLSNKAHDSERRMLDCTIDFCANEANKDAEFEKEQIEGTGEARR